MSEARKRFCLSPGPCRGSIVHHEQGQPQEVAESGANGHIGQQESQETEDVVRQSARGSPTSNYMGGCLTYSCGRRIQREDKYASL